MEEHQNISIFYFRRHLDFKSSISHFNFMENVSSENLKKCKLSGLTGSYI